MNLPETLGQIKSMLSFHTPKSIDRSSKQINLLVWISYDEFWSFFLLEDNLVS